MSSLSPSGREAYAIDTAAYKTALGSFATGVTLATTSARGEIHGVTASAVVSVSLEPRLVLLSIQAGTRMHAVLGDSDNFALNILSSTQLDVALYFADSTKPHGEAAFTQFPSQRGSTGAPLLDGALAHVECAITAVYPAGDHVLYIGEAVSVGSRRDAKPLLYYRGLLSSMLP